MENKRGYNTKGNWVILVARRKTKTLAKEGSSTELTQILSEGPVRLVKGV